MNQSGKRKRMAFRPTVIESRLEERLVLSGGTGTAAATPAVAVLSPAIDYQQYGLTPPPAPTPVSARVARLESGPLTKARLRADYNKAVKLASRDLQAAITSQIGQLYANGATPTAQQLADFNASIAGALNATALRLSIQASLLPHAGNKLVPAIQNAILGSGSNSLASRLTALAQSGQLSGTTGASSRALTNLLNTATRQTTSQMNNYFSTTPVNRLSVNSSGQQIPLKQYIGGQVLNQVGNTLGALANSFPNVANSMLYPNGVTTGTPSQSAMSAFTTQYNNALGTAAFELGSALSLLPGTQGLVSQIQPLLFGTGTTGTGTGLGTGTGTSLGTGTSTSLLAALQGLQFGTSNNLGSAVSNAFGNAFQNLNAPIGHFFGISSQGIPILETSGFTSPFGSSFMGSSFFNGFNGGFASGTTPGFIGFGTAPTAFNSSFGTGFNNFVSTFNTNLGLTQSNPVTGTSTGQSISTSNPATGTSTGQSISTSNPATGTSSGTGLLGATGTFGSTGTTGSTGLTSGNGTTGLTNGNGSTFTWSGPMVL